jgi:hypothetical protein
MRTAILHETHALARAPVCVCVAFCIYLCISHTPSICLSVSLHADGPSAWHRCARLARHALCTAAIRTATGPSVTRYWRGTHGRVAVCVCVYLSERKKVNVCACVRVFVSDRTRVYHPLPLFLTHARTIHARTHMLTPVLSGWAGDWGGGGGEQSFSELWIQFLMSEAKRPAPAPPTP